ncbi:hypothetical protein ACE6H2_020529 [Prunus campanulata]
MKNKIKSRNTLSLSLSLSLSTQLFSLYTQRCSPTAPQAEGHKDPPSHLSAPGILQGPQSPLRRRLSQPPILLPRRRLGPPRPSPLCLHPLPPPAQNHHPRLMSPSSRKMSLSPSVFAPLGTASSTIGLL